MRRVSMLLHVVMINFGQFVYGRGGRLVCTSFRDARAQRDRLQLWVRRVNGFHRRVFTNQQFWQLILVFCYDVDGEPKLINVNIY